MQPWKLTTYTNTINHILLVPENNLFLLSKIPKSEMNSCKADYFFTDDIQT